MSQYNTPNTPFQIPVVQQKKKGNSGIIVWTIIILVVLSCVYVYNQSTRETQKNAAIAKKAEAARVEKATAERKIRDAERAELAKAGIARQEADKAAKRAEKEAADAARLATADSQAKQEEEKAKQAATAQAAKSKEEQEEDARIKASVDAEWAAAEAQANKELAANAKKEAAELEKRKVWAELKDPFTGKNPIAIIEKWPAEKKGVKDKPMGEWKWESVPKNTAYTDFPGKDGKAWTDSRRGSYAKAVDEALAKGMEDRSTIPAFPAAADFPGIPEDGTPLISRTITIDPKVGGWHSTGLYALPGVPVRIRGNSKIAGENGWEVKIGCHTDRLEVERHSSWNRSPKIASSGRITKPTVEVTNPFGGLIYINPRGENKSPVSITIENAAAAPHYRLGVSTPEEWKEMLKTTVPWGEISTPRLIISLPLDQLKTIPDIEAMALHIQKDMQGQDWLSGFDLKENDMRTPMRFAVDRQISAGSGHSGYPAMGHLDWGHCIADGSYIGRGSWGWGHELGHNHQRAPFVFEGMGEITVNLFSLISQAVCSFVPINECWGGGILTRDDIPDFLSSKQTFMEMDAGLQFSFFGTMMHHLRMEPFRYAAVQHHKKPYKDLSNSEKWDWLMYELSVGSKHDLSKYFEIWKVPVTEGGKRRVQALRLPVWLPEPDYPKELIERKKAKLADTATASE